MLRDLPSALLVVGAIPLVWSAALCGLRAVLRRGRLDSMRLEGAVLTLMIAPVAAGALALAAGAIAPAGALPALDLPEIAWGGAAAGGAAPDAAAPAAAPRVDPLSTASLAMFAVWAIGAALAAIRLLRARARLDRVTAASAPAPGIGPGVRLTDEPVPAYATACGAIVLPRALMASLPARDLALIVRHERAHIERGDPRAFWALAWIDAAFWPSPFVRRQTERCRLAAELACDAAVVAGAPAERSVYARALVAAARHSAEGPRWAPAVFTSRSEGETTMRLTRIMSKTSARRSRLARAAVVVAGAAILPVAALQLAACTTGTARDPLDVVGDPATAPDFARIVALPVQDARYTSLWGSRIDPNTGLEAQHHGVDLAAHHLAPIYAAADGKVSYVGWRGGYGRVVEIDHGRGLKTRAAHLDAASVARGDRVKAGQHIGDMGSTGQSTGDHLHWEVWYKGKVYDPMPVLARLGLVYPPAAAAPAVESVGGAAEGDPSP